MKKTRLAIFAVLICFGTSLGSIQAQTYTRPSTAELNRALQSTKGFSNIFKNLRSRSFKNKGTHFEAKISKNRVIIYKQRGKKIANVAFIAPSIKLSDLIPAVKGTLGNVTLKNVTMIIVSPNSYLGKKQGSVNYVSLPKPITTKVSSLPAPIAASIRAAHKNQQEVTLPTGIFTFSQFQLGNNKFADDVLKFVGVGSPVVSSLIMDASNYKDVASGKATASLSILLKKDNAINKMVDRTQVLKSVAAPLPVLTIFASTKGDALGVAYRSPYKLPNKTTPIQTAMAFERKNNKISGTLTADLGKMTNPTIVPKAIELKGVTMHNVKLKIGFEPGGKKGPEIIVGFATPEMVVKKNTTYAPVHLQLAMTPAGTPSGALIDIKTKNTVDLAAIADLAEVAINARPGSKGIPSWARKDISKNLKLNTLPTIGIKKPQIYLATPGQDKSTHLADLHDIGGAGVRVKGDLVVFNKTVAKADLGLDRSRGLKAAASITTFNVGPLALEKASFDLQADTVSAPYFKMEGKATIKGVTFSESELKFSNKGISWIQNLGCTPPMMEITFETNVLKPKTLSLKPSGCAAKIAKAVAEAGKVAATQVAKSTKKAAKSAIDAGEKAGKWVGGAANEAKKFAKRTGCKVKKFFGGSCKKRNREAERKKKHDHALAVAANYRKKIGGPGSCGQGWYWNHKYRTCWQGADRKMLFYVFEGAKKGLCMNVLGAERKPGATMIIWDCNANARQQFRMIPIKNSKEFYIQTSRGYCLRAKADEKRPQGAPILTAKCKNVLRQRWRLVGSRLIGYKGLCLRSQLLSQKRSKLILDNCHAGPNIELFKSKIADLKKQKANVNKDYDKLTKPLKGFGSKFSRAVIRQAKQKRDHEISKINKSIKAQKANLKSAIELIRNPSKTPVEWVVINPKQNAAKYYHAKFKAPSRASLSINGWCLESPYLLPEQRMYFRKCDKKSSAQAFSIGIVKGNYFTLVPRNSRMCTDLFAYKKKDMAKIVTWPCNYGGNQMWLAVVGGQKTTSAKTFTHKTGFMIKSAHSGKCLAPFGMTKKGRKAKHGFGTPPRFGIKATNGALLVQMKCNPRDTNMRFKFSAH